MIVLIAPEEDLKKETEIVNQLFLEGLAYYHLRKPLKNKQEHIQYLEKINPNYHDKIVTHLFHDLINDFNLKGIHFQEQKRRDVLENGSGYFNTLNMAGKSISSSFHEPETIEKCTFEFDYHLLSPVFSSISKQGYLGKGFTVNHIPKKIIGMGGVTVDNLNEFKTMGYQGVGVLGGIWNSNNPVESFKKMHKIVKTIF